MTDPIADMLNRIRNAQSVSSDSVSVPYSKIKYEIASIMQKEGFVKDVEKKGRKEKRIIKIIFKEGSGRLGLKRVSKPGQRLYSSYREIKPIRGGYGIAVVSTSKGIVSSKEAKKNRLGGEIICEIW